MDNNDFIEFMHSFDGKFLQPASEISRSHTGRMDVLVKSNAPMYSLDDICKDSPKLSRKLPKTTDAIQYSFNADRMKLFIVEFKFFNMDGDNSNYQLLEAIHRALKKKNGDSERCISDNLLKAFENVKEDFVDSVEFSLRLKPFETLMIALPVLYEEYCGVEGSKKDFRKFLEEVEVELYVFVHKINPIRNISAQRQLPHSINRTLNNQYSRMKLARLISHWDILEASSFDEFISKNNLG